MGKNRVRSFELLRQVYDELYTQLADEFTPAELLRAAQTLIDVTNEEYANSNYEVGQTHAGYFSFDVDRMILGRGWWLLENERKNDDLGDERLSENIEALTKIRRYYNPDRYLHRG